MLSAISKLFKSEPPAETRGCSDDSLKWCSTANLCTLALARMMEAQGVDDQPLIDELYKRGRTEAKAQEKALKK